MLDLEIAFLGAMVVVGFAAASLVLEFTDAVVESLHLGRDNFLIQLHSGGISSLQGLAFLCAQLGHTLFN